MRMEPILSSFRLTDHTRFAYALTVEFIEAPLFTQMLPDFLKDDEYRELQQHLSRDPEAGDVMPGTGGFRKLRWADTRRGKGKRGGLLRSAFSRQQSNARRKSVRGIGRNGGNNDGE